jgi:hypothetical protein
LDEVFGVQQAQQRPPRSSGEGLSGSSKRFVTLLTLMVGLTAVPTFIMVRAGVEELRSSAATPVRPILLVVPEKPSPTNKQPFVSEPQLSWSLPIVPPEPVAPQQEPVLERKAVVDTSARPVARKPKAARRTDPPPPPRPSIPEAPQAPQAPALPRLKPMQRKHQRQHRDHVEWPIVDRPQKPDVTRPYRDRVERPRS